MILLYLKAAHLNGTVGILQDWDESTGRFGVDLGGEVGRAIRPANLATLTSHMYENFINEQSSEQCQLAPIGAAPKGATR